MSQEYYTVTPEEGCLIEGHWGQYAPARLIQIAVSYGWENPEAENIAHQHLRSMECVDDETLTLDEFETLMESCDEAENWLNNNIADDAHVFTWEDGEFYYQRYTSHDEDL